MWIRISEKMPERNVFVLLNQGGEITTGCYAENWDTGKSFFLHSCECCQIPLNLVDSWMPLPNPPNSENAESETHPPTGQAQNG